MNFVIDKLSHAYRCMGRENFGGQRLFCLKSVHVCCKKVPGHGPPGKSQNSYTLNAISRIPNLAFTTKFRFEECKFVSGVIA